MDLVPITNQCEDQQDKGNQEQTGGLRSIPSMAVTPVRIFLFNLGGEHENIVAPLE